MAFGTDSKVCSACLSDDRELIPLSEFGHIMQLLPSLQLKPYDDSVCWECKALLKRIYTFHLTVDKAQKYFKNRSKKNTRIHSTSLSSLKIHIQIDEEQSIEYKEPAKVEQPVVLDEKDDKVDIDVNNFKTETPIKVEALDETSYYDEACGSPFNGEDYLFVVGKTEDKLTEDLNLKLEKADLELKAQNNFKKKQYKKYVTPHKIFTPSEIIKLKKWHKVKIDSKELDSWRESMSKAGKYVKLEFKCTTCYFSWSKQDVYDKHMLKYHNQSNPHTCDICARRFARMDELSRHVSRHYRVLQCAACGKQCAAERDIHRHARTHPKVTQCVECDVLFPTFRRYSSHRKALHATFVCDTCGKKCSAKTSLMRHMEKHQSTFHCSTCNKQFTKRRTYRSHMTLHHQESQDENSYCVTCDVTFKNRHLYRRHLTSSVIHRKETSVPKPKKKFVCSECGNVYSRHTFMMNHYRYVHMKQTKHYCRECDTYFLNSTSYQRHRRKHEGVKLEKNKICNICGRGFTLNRTLIHHVRTHTGERPHACPHCPAAFAQRYAMTSHVKHVHMQLKRNKPHH